MKRPVIIHPILFAVYPILFLASHNVGLATLAGIPRSLLVVTAFASFLWLFSSYILKSKQKGGLAASIFLILFFSYGHVDNLIGKFWTGYITIGNLPIGPSKTIFLIWILIFSIFFYTIAKTRWNLIRFTIVSNIVGATLVLISLINITNYILHSKTVMQNNITEGEILTDKISLQTPDNLPNIYYIILDGYARSDILKNTYKLDNAEFLNRLSQKGFYIVHRSRPNYAQTILSLASSLNITYLDNVASSLGSDSENREPLMRMIQYSRLINFLRTFGYKFVVFPSGYWGTEIHNADIHMNSGIDLSEFENLLLSTTPVPKIAKKLFNPWDRHRRRILYTLDHLAETTKLDTPVFVFAHIICPHPPFVFGENGEKIDQGKINYKRTFTFADGINLEYGLDIDEYLNSYRKQVLFINRRIESTVDDIISKSANPPVIILQGDHGPSSLLDSGLSNPNSANLEERMSILNAIYLPAIAHDQLYETMTPVNTFRVILNTYFNTDLKLLKDECYFSTWDEPYKFIRIEDAVEEN